MGKRNQNFANIILKLLILSFSRQDSRVAKPKKTVYGKRQICYLTNNLTQLNCALPEYLKLSCSWPCSLSQNIDC